MRPPLHTPCTHGDSKLIFRSFFVVAMGTQPSVKHYHICPQNCSGDTQPGSQAVPRGRGSECGVSQTPTWAGALLLLVTEDSTPRPAVSTLNQSSAERERWLPSPHLPSVLRVADRVTWI